MKIKVIDKPPIEAKHGVEVGNVYEARKDDTGGRGRRDSVWIDGAAGEPVRLLSHEWELVK